MSNTPEGAKKAIATILARNPNHFEHIGSLGGKAPHKQRGFQAMDRVKIQAAGKLGGSRSKRGPHEEGCTCLVHSNRVGGKKGK